MLIFLQPHRRTPPHARVHLVAVVLVTASLRQNAERNAGDVQDPIRPYA